MKEALHFLTYILFLLQCVILVNSHGNMYFPPPWHNLEFHGSTRPGDLETAATWRPDQWERVTYPEPEEICEDGANEDYWCSSYMIDGAQYDWNTNYTFIPGEPTLPMEFCYGSESHCEEIMEEKNPWTAPGTAPILGEGCGANGGNPQGCWEDDPLPYGHCCKYQSTCGGNYAYGKSAMEHAAEGLFIDAAITTWKRGEPAPVIFVSHAHHWGGYAYRLCKVPSVHTKYSEVNEECFSRGYLDFAGDKQWLNYYTGAGANFDSNEWTEQEAIRYTTPEGSQWTMINPPRMIDGERWVFGDQVEVPESQEPGEYVLSFRWDCQNTAQIWSACANIEIV